MTTAMTSTSERSDRRVTGHSAPKHARPRLLQAARELLSEGGVEAATARAICQRADVRAPSLYHHFGDLHRLHGAAINTAFVDIMAEYRREAVSGRTLAAIKQSWHAFMYFARNEPRLARLFIARALDGEMPEALRLTLWRLRKDLTNMQEKNGQPADPTMSASLLWTAAIGAVSVSAQKGAEAAEVTEHLLDAVLASIGIPTS